MVARVIFYCRLVQVAVLRTQVYANIPQISVVQATLFHGCLWGILSDCIIVCRGRKYPSLRSRRPRSRSSRCRGALDSAVHYTRSSVELISTLGLVQRTAQSSRSSRCRGTLDSAVRCTRPVVELQWTLGLAQRTALSSRSSRCRGTLDSAVHYTRPSVELISTLGLVQRTAQSSRSSRCRATLDSAMRYTRPDTELRSTHYSTTFYAIFPEILPSSGWPLKSEDRNFLQN